MFTSFLDSIDSYFGKRFLLSSFFPTLIVVYASIGIAILLNGVEPSLNLWKTQLPEVKTWIATSLFFLVLFPSYVVHMFHYNLLRFFEGYWEDFPFLGKWLQKIGTTYYQKRWDYFSKITDQLSEEIIAAEGELKRTIAKIHNQSTRRTERQVLDHNFAKQKQEIESLKSELVRLGNIWLISFPTSRNQVMPTQLGNIIRASESYSFQRYGIDAVIIWPRLQGILPNEFLESIKEAKTSLDLLTLFAAFSIAFSTAWGIGLGLFSSRLDLFALISMGWIFAWLSYKSALRAAIYYGELIKSSFDLYRWRLLEAFNFEQPQTIDKERELWEHINQFLYRNYLPPPKVMKYKKKKNP